MDFNKKEIEKNCIDRWIELAISNDKRTNVESKLTIEIIHKYPTHRKRRSSEIDTLTRKKSCLINQAKYGTLPLNEFRSRVGKANTDKCHFNTCKTTESRRHFLFYCKGLKDLRKKLLNSEKIKNRNTQLNTFDWKKRKKLAEFISTGLNKRIKNYDKHKQNES